MATPLLNDLDQQLVDELAQVFIDEQNARVIVLRAGFPPARVPAFRNALTFWTSVISEARAGVLEGGVTALARQAHGQFPANATFASHGGILSAESPARWPTPQPRSQPARAPTHTAIVLDRTHAWQSLKSKSANTADNRAFIVHGTWQQDLDLFMRRIETYFRDPKECERPHDVLKVSPVRDFSDGVTAEDWERAVIEATRARQPPLEYALEDQAIEQPVLLLLCTEGPLRDLQDDQREGLLEFLSQMLPEALGRASLVNPVRVVVPVEDTPVLVELLQEALYGVGSSLGVEPPIRLDLPEWTDVLPHVMDEFARHRLRPDKSTIQHCRRRYEQLMAREPSPRLRELADELHAQLQRSIAEAKRRR